MATILSGLWPKGQSPILDSWPLYQEPLTVPLILVSYVAFVVYIGPKFMKKRAAYNLKPVIILYNAMQVCYNLWALLLSVRDTRFWNDIFHFNCNQMDPLDREDYEALLRYAYWHITVNKLLDLFDTVFFVLCKKQNHVTFLHVQHHVLSVTIVWISAKYFTGHEFSVAFVCNTTVHTTMYFYYMIAALGPAFKKYLWWKKYLTIMQMVQFVIIGTYAIAAFRVSCGFDNRVNGVILFNACLNFSLFFHFFLKTYSSKKVSAE